MAEVEQPVWVVGKRVDADPVNPEARHREHGVDGPERGGEGVADPRLSVAGNGVHLVNQEPDVVAAG